MKILGPSSVSASLYRLVLIAYYGIVLFCVVVVIHMAFGLADYYGLPNFLSSLSMDTSNFDLSLKLFGSSIKSSRIVYSPWLTMITILAILSFYSVLFFYLKRIFKEFSSGKLFVKEIVHCTKKITQLLFIGFIVVVVGALIFGLDGDLLVYAMTILIITCLLLLLSAVVEKGFEIQQELDLTI